MTDYYFSGSETAIQAFAQQTADGIYGPEITAIYPNTLGPQPGRAAFQSINDDGTAGVMIAAVGDPNLWYVGIRTNQTITPPENISDAGTDGPAVLGIWF